MKNSIHFENLQDDNHKNYLKAAPNVISAVMAKNMVSELEDTMIYFVNFANKMKKTGSCLF